MYDHALADVRSTAAGIRCLYCNDERHFKLSDIGKIVGTLPMDLTINTVILAVQEIIYTYRNREICVSPLH